MQNYILYIELFYEGAPLMTLEKKKSAYQPSSPAVEQAARMMLCLGQSRSGEMNLTDLCREVGIHKSKGFSILNALASHDLISKNPETKAYSLGPALMPLAQKVNERFDLATAARESLEKLAEETETSVLLGVISNDRFYIAAQYDGHDLLSITIRRYQSMPLTHGAHGKAIFAFLDETEKKRVMESGRLFFHGSSGNPDMQRLEEEVRLCRRNGYSFDNGELTPGLKAISSPIFDSTNNVVAALVIVGTFPDSKVTVFGDKALIAARTISRLAGARL